MLVVDDLLDESWTERGAAMAGSAMLAARRTCLNCIVAMFAKVRIAKARGGCEYR